MKNLLLTICLIAFSMSTMAQIKCTIKGTVIGRPDDKELSLYIGSGFYANTDIKINIENGEFSYVLEAPHAEIYELIFTKSLQRGDWGQSIYFHATNGTIEFELYSRANSHKNKTIGGGRESEIIMGRYARGYSVKKKVDEIYPIMNPLTYKRRFSEKALELRAKRDMVMGVGNDKIDKKLKELEDSGELYTTEHYALHARVDSIYAVYHREEAKFDRETPSLIVYSRLVTQLSRFKAFSRNYKGEGTPMEYILERYAFYSKVYPNHIYTERCKELIEIAKEMDTTRP